MATAEDMAMQVGHAFSAVAPVVDHKPEAAFGNPGLTGHFRRFRKQVPKKGRVPVRGFGDARDRFFGNQQDVNGCLGLDVSKRQHEVVFVDNVGGYLPGDDAFEECHVRYKQWLVRSKFRKRNSAIERTTSVRVLFPVVGSEPPFAVPRTISHPVRILFLTLLTLCVIRVHGRAAEPSGKLFDASAVHVTHLRFTSDQWQAIEPKHRDIAGPVFTPPPADSSDVMLSRDVEFSYVHADMDFDGVEMTNVAVRYKGKGTYFQSRATLKRPFKIDLNEFVKGRKMEGAGKINFHNNVADPSGMNEALAYALYREAGIPAPRTSYSRLYVSVPGRFTNQYFGLYTTVENPDQNWAGSLFGGRKGTILKPSTRELFRYEGEEWGRYRATYDPKTPVMESQARRVIDFAKLVTNADETEFASRLPEFLDLEEFARFLAVTVCLSSLDSILGMGENFIIYLDPTTGRFSFVPWDLDQAFGGFALIGTQEQRERLDIDHPWVGRNRFLERVTGVKSFRDLYRARLAEYQTNLFSPARLSAEVDRLAALIRPAVVDEGAAKASRFDRVAAGQQVTPTGANGEIPSAELPVASDVPKPIKSFVQARHASIAGQLSGRQPGLVIDAGDATKIPQGSAESLAAILFARADTDGDHVVSRREFSALAEKWFSEWGGVAGGVLSLGHMKAGLRAAASGQSPAPAGTGDFLAQTVLSEFDRDHSGAISRGEFSAGFITWFSAWDSSRSGTLSSEQMVAGVRRIIAPLSGSGSSAPAKTGAP